MTGGFHSKGDHRRSPSSNAPRATEVYATLTNPQTRLDIFLIWCIFYTMITKKGNKEFLVIINQIFNSSRSQNEKSGLMDLFYKQKLLFCFIEKERLFNFHIVNF